MSLKNRKKNDFRKNSPKKENTKVNAKAKVNANASVASVSVPHLPETARIARNGGLILYGWHAVMAALHNNKRKKLHLFVNQDNYRELTEKKQLLDLPDITILNRQQMDRLFSTPQTRENIVHQNIALSVKPLEEMFVSDITATLDDRSFCRLLMLDQITDPRNIGAILRTASAFGVSAIIMTARHAPQETGTLAKAAVGALETVPLIRVTNLARALEAIKDMGFTIIGLEAKANGKLENFADQLRLCLVLGAEGTGMRRLSRENCDMLVSIDMAQTSESLNVSVATGIALYALKQR